MKEFRQGNWSIVHQTRQVFDVMGKKVALKKPITFPVLRHLDKIVMSATPQEVGMMKKDTNHVRGDALVAGLGLGVILKFLRPKCRRIVVVEKNEDVIRLYRRYVGKKLLYDHLVQCSIEEYLEGYGSCLDRYDFIHLDTWYDLHTELLPHVNYLIAYARTRLRDHRRSKIRAWGYDWMVNKFVEESVELWETSRVKVIRARPEKIRRMSIAYPLLGKFVAWMRKNKHATKDEVREQAEELAALEEKSEYPLEYADDINKMLAFQEEPIWKQFQRNLITHAQSAKALST